MKETLNEKADLIKYEYEKWADAKQKEKINPVSYNILISLCELAKNNISTTITASFKVISNCLMTKSLEEKEGQLIKNEKNKIMKAFYCKDENKNIIFDKCSEKILDILALTRTQL